MHRWSPLAGFGDVFLRLVGRLLELDIDPRGFTSVVIVIVAVILSRFSDLGNFNTKIAFLSTLLRP